jgi:hypothetical protein
MTTFRIEASAGDGETDPTIPSPDTPDHGAVLSVVREDIRQTLRMGWIDPSFDALAAQQPVFFTAAWSAMRPNVGKSFLALARSLRAGAAEAVRSSVDLPDLRKRLADRLSEEELQRIELCVKAAHLATVKVQIVVHAFYRAIRRDLPRSTGVEEPPVRRGVPDWQRWMSFQPPSPEAQAILDEAGTAFGLGEPPASLRLLSRWPAALQPTWKELKRRRGTESWRTGGGMLRRMLLRGIQTLPHPIELQWPALKARGYVEADRSDITEILASSDEAMPGQALTAAFLWAAFGAPEVGSEG